MAMRLLLALLLCGLFRPAAEARGAEGITPIGALNASFKGKDVTVEGTVAGARRFSAGMRYVLADGESRITVVVFDRVLKSVAKPEAIDAGAAIRARGKVDVYQGQLQLVPSRAQDLTVLRPASVVSETAARLETIGPADKGKRAAVEGTVVGTASFAAGFKFTLNDGTGQIVMVLFDRDYDALAGREALDVGATVRAKGVIGVFGKDVEIVPAAKDVAVTPGPKPAARPYKLGAITGNDHNALVWVRGEIAVVEPHEGGGARVLLKDDTGAQRVVIYANVLKRLPKTISLTAGTMLSVIGRVRAARATGIRIEPALPFDVSVVTAKDPPSASRPAVDDSN